MLKLEDMARSIIIIGPGALGVGIGYHCQAAGFNFCFLGRHGIVGNFSMEVKEGGGNQNSSSLQASASLGNSSLAFVAVKSYAFIAAIEQHLPLLPEGIVVIPVANGYLEPDIMWARERFPKNIWRMGFTTLAVTAKEAGVFHLLNPGGKVVWGPVDPLGGDLTPAEEALIVASKEVFSWNKDARYWVRKKWLFNTALNSLVGAYRLQKNGDAFDREQELQSLFDEAYDLGERQWGQWRDSKDLLYADLKELIEATSENENSMVRDLRQCRQTENKFLAGIALGFEGYPNLKRIYQIIERSENNS